MLVTFRVKNIVSFCVKKLLHFALKSCYILRQKLLHFGLMLHFASKVVTFGVNETFCVNCYILRRNIAQEKIMRPKLLSVDLRFDSNQENSETFSQNPLFLLVTF